jgi:drug/metabolite transporter (DMT)-like permease
MRAWLALATTLVLWSSAYAGIRVALHAYGPGQLAVLRFMIASAVMVVYASAGRLRRPDLRDVPWLFAAGGAGITFYMLGLNYGEVTVTAGAASLLIASAPIWTALLGMLFLGERLRVVGWLGVLISFLGVALIASGESGGIHFSPRALVLLAAALSSATYTVMQKHFLARYNALELTAYTIWTGTLLMFPFAGGWLHALRAAPLHATLIVVYLGVFPAALGYVTYLYALSHGTAGSTASFLYLIPVLAIFIAWVWLGETPRVLSLVGGAIALIGVAMVNMWGRVLSR